MANIFKLWPNPKDGKPYGPSGKQRLLFIEDLPDVDTIVDDINIKRPHYHGTDIVMFIGGARSGKCLGKDTPVIMYDGSIKLVQDIIEGDLLMGPDSLPRTVVSLARGRETMYKITPSNGNSFTCNESHILSFKTRNKRKYVGSTKGIKRWTHISGDIVNMTVREYLDSSKRTKRVLKSYKANCIHYPNPKTLDIDPYFLGLWLGDGSKRNLGITNIDKAVIEYIKGYSESLSLKVRESRTKSSSATTYYITSGEKGGNNYRNSLTNGFNKYSLLNNKHIPKDFLTAIEEDRLQLLAGLIDSDGYLANGYYYEIIQKNKTLTDDIVFLARSLGFKVTVRRNRKKLSVQRREENWEILPYQHIWKSKKNPSNLRKKEEA